MVGLLTSTNETPARGEALLIRKKSFHNWTRSMDVEGVDPAIIIHCNDGEFQGTFLTNSISSLVPEIPMKNVFCKCFNGQAR